MSYTKYFVDDNRQQYNYTGKRVLKKTKTCRSPGPLLHHRKKLRMALVFPSTMISVRPFPSSFRAPHSLRLKWASFLACARKYPPVACVFFFKSSFTQQSFASCYVRLTAAVFFVFVVFFLFLRFLFFFGNVLRRTTAVTDGSNNPKRGKKGRQAGGPVGGAEGEGEGERRFPFICHTHTQTTGCT